MRARRPGVRCEILSKIQIRVSHTRMDFETRRRPILDNCTPYRRLLDAGSAVADRAAGHMRLWRGGAIDQRPSTFVYVIQRCFRRI